MKFTYLSDILPPNAFIDWLKQGGSRPSGNFVMWVSKMHQDAWVHRCQQVLYDELVTAFTEHCAAYGNKPGERPDLVPSDEWSDKLDDAVRDVLLEIRDVVGMSAIEEATVGGAFEDNVNLATAARDFARRAYEGHKTRYSPPPKMEAATKTIGELLSSAGLDSIALVELGKHYGVEVSFTEADLTPSIRPAAPAPLPPPPPPAVKKERNEFPHTRRVVAQFVAKAGGDPALLNRDVLTDLFLQLTDDDTTATAMQQLGGTQELVKEIRAQHAIEERSHGEIYANNGEWIMALISSVAGSTADVVFAPEGVGGMVPPPVPSFLPPPLPTAAAAPVAAPAPAPAAPLPLPLPGAPAQAVMPPPLPETKKTRKGRQAGTPLAVAPVPGSVVPVENAPLAPIVGMLRAVKDTGTSEKEIYEALGLSRSQYSNMMQGKVAAPALTPAQREHFAKVIRDKMETLATGYKALE